MQYDKLRDKIATQLAVNSARLERRLSKLDTEDLFAVYEEGSNWYFHTDNIDKRAVGATMISAATRVLVERYPKMAELDLNKPFPLRDWYHGKPAGATNAEKKAK